MRKSVQARDPIRERMERKKVIERQIIERTGGPGKCRPETEVCLDRFERACRPIQVQVHHFVLTESGIQRRQCKMKEVRHQQTHAGRIQCGEIVPAGTIGFDQGSRIVRRLRSNFRSLLQEWMFCPQACRKLARFSPNRLNQ